MLIVFLRGVNVGGNRKFRPSLLAREMGDLDVASVGAAGTFVVRGEIDQESLRIRVLSELPFDTKLMICTASEIGNLARGVRLTRDPSKNAKLFVTVLETPPRIVPHLPIEQPPGDDWQVKVHSLVGRFVLSFWRKGKRAVYPNEVAEKIFGQSATTRTWTL